MAKPNTRTPRRNPRENPQESPQGNESVESDSFSPIEGIGLFSDISIKEDDYVRVLRRDDTEKTLVFHGKLAPEEATSEKIAELFGGGYYKCIYFQRNETGAYAFARARIVRLPGPYKPPTGQLPGVGTPVGASNISQPSARVEVGSFDGMNPNAALNHALVASVIDLLKSMREQPKVVQPQIDWASILAVLSPLAVRLLDRKEEKVDVMEIVRQVKELLPGGASNPPTPVSNTVSDMIKGIKELMGLKDIVEGKAEPADPETAMFTLAGKALDVIATRGMPGPAAPASDAPAQSQLPTGGTMPKWKLLLLSQKKAMLNAASFGLDPGTAAETALTFLPPQMHGVLTEFLSHPDHVEITMQTIPELREFVGWTTEFFKELATQFQGEEVTDATEGSERQASQEG